MQDIEVPTHVLLAEKERQYDEEQRAKYEKIGAKVVILKGIDIPFFDLVKLLVKVAFAAIPAAIIVTVISSAIFAFFAGMFRGQ